MASEGSYSPAVGLIFVFNLIVGTGALAMPRAFQDAGWLLSVILVCLIAFTSYATVTLVVEAMACANAVLNRAERARNAEIQSLQDSASWVSESVNCAEGLASDERRLLLSNQPVRQYASVADRTEQAGGDLTSDDFDITKRVELGQMMSMFSNKVGVAVFYVVMAIYLYGDLAIYSAAVPKSLRDVMCTYSVNGSANATLDDSAPCWSGTSAINRASAYRLCVAAFTLLLGPFVFFNVQKTLLIQVVTSALRWIAFISMVVLALIKLTGDETVDGKAQRPSAADFTEAPNLFGVCVYAFMCHHSLPSLVTPMRTKRRLLLLFAADFALILAFYLLLSLTGSFAFPSLPDLYTLNFEPNTAAGDSAARGAVVLQYFLALYPVFAISASYPIVGITLRNNLKAVALVCAEANGRRQRSCTAWFQQSWCIDRLAFPLAVLLPPLAIALATNDLQFLVGFTGSYAGVGIQYFVPIVLAFCCRRALSKNPVSGKPYAIKHAYQSPFNNPSWLLVLTLWAAASIILVTYNHISTGK